MNFIVGAIMGTSGKSLLIVSYEWVLENVEKDLNTIASNLILFRGEKVFRVALRNSDKGQSTLFFLAINLNKIGLQVSEIHCAKEDVDSLCSMSEIKPYRKKEENLSGEGNFQLFTCNVNVINGEKCTFVFQIHLEGIVADYCYTPCDPLAKMQLWATVNSELHADVEFIVQDTRFAAHKAILAARSPVFRAEFTKEESKKTNTCQIQIDDVDASSLEQFLHFIYTGEFLHFDYTGKPMTPLLANENLLKLANRYQLKTLENLCQVALLEVAEKMAHFVAHLRSSDEQKTSCKIR